MTPEEWTAIVERDRQTGSRLPSSVWPEYQSLADRRALIALVEEMRDVLVDASHAFEASNHEGARSAVEAACLLASIPPKP